ncbi:MAG: hypothetical protein WDM77_11405 [Steroidobacteraceae bacterium]
MTSERVEEFAKPPVSVNIRVSDTGEDGTTESASSHNAAVPDKDNKVDDASRHKAAKPSVKEVSEAKVKMQSRLPALEDDADIAQEKEHIVTRDSKADLAFMGTLLASAAPESATNGHWKEYRIYRTSSGKHVFSRVARSVFAEENDTYEAEVFDPSPSSVPSQLLKGAREMVRSRPLTWMDAAVAFFGYDPLAKVLYRKLSVRFEELIA